MSFERDAALRRVLVIAAPPTPNGDLHLGHLCGPYLAADICTRYLRLRGSEVHSYCGTDDNQSDVLTRSEQMKLSPRETADLFADEIQTTLAAARIRFDHFIRPIAEPEYGPMAQRFFLRLHRQGALVEREAPAPYCEGCDRYLYEGYIEGRCPRCGRRSTGNCCEDCGFPNDSIDLLEAVCTRCRQPPSRRIFKRLLLPLSRHVDALQDYWAQAAMSPSLRSFCEQELAAGLPDIAVTHPNRWGLPVPVSGYEGQTIATWCEEAARTLFYASCLGKEWEHFWRSPEAAAVQCFGFDNSFYYAVFVPAALHALDPEIRPPGALLMNQFSLLEGEKFSTSRGRAIWGRELLAVAPADLVRFYLSRIRPDAEKTSFHLSGFVDAVDQELLGEWQPWLEEMAIRMRHDFGSRVPAADRWTEAQRRFQRRIEALRAEAAEAYEARTFSPPEALRALGALVREARRFATSEESGPTAGALELLAAKALAILSAPILPDFAERLWRHLGYEGPLSEHRWEDPLQWLPSGQSLCGLNAVSYFESAREAVSAKWPV